MSSTAEQRVEHQMHQFGRLLSQCGLRFLIINCVYLVELVSIALLLCEKYLQTIKKTIQATFFVCTRHFEVLIQNVNLIKFAATNLMLIIVRPDYVVPDLPDPAPTTSALSSLSLGNSLTSPSRTNPTRFQSEPHLD